MNPIFKRMQSIKVLPVVVIHESSDAIPLARALLQGGITCAEITFRTSAAPKAIQLMKEAYPDMLVGAGTILNVEQAEAAYEAGAQFILSPGFDEEVVAYGIQHDIVVIPGIQTASELQKARNMGIEVVKFFPAEASGGIAMIKALCAPYPTMHFIPTGGIQPQNMKEYILHENVLAIGGSWMVPSKDIQEKNFEYISELSKEAIKLIQEMTI